MKRLLLFSLFIIMLASLSANPEKMVARIDSPTSAILERFLLSGADIASYKPGVYLDLVVTAGELANLKTDFPGMYITQTEDQLKQNLMPQKDLPGYLNYSQVVTELNQLQAQYPSLMQLSTIGSSWGAQYAAQNLPAYADFDHEIWAVKVSANAAVEEDKPAFYFVGEHHAREPLGTQVCMGILTYLLENYGTDPVVTSIMDTTEIWIVPLLNPDGHKIVLDQTDVWWRKNINDNNNNHSFDHQNYGDGLDGVDLNRNYGYYWGYTSATDTHSDATYHGTGPFSELETQALRNLLLSKRFLAGIGYHTYGELVLYPFGYVDSIIAPDGAELQALANETAALLPGLSGGNYTPEPSWSLYPASGTLDDWCYAKTNAFAYTIEMAQQFIPSATQVTQIVTQQTAGAINFLQRKDKKILQGHITDISSGDPIVATVYIEGFDDNPLYRSPIKSNELFGAYYYLLPVGNYTVRYLCPGYATETRNVTIISGAPTIQDVSMTPTVAYPLEIQIQGDFFEPLSNATLTISDGVGLPYTSDDGGNIILPEFYPGEYLFTVSKPGYETLSLLREVSSPSITLRITSMPLITEDFELNISNWSTVGSWNRTTADHYNGSYSLADSPSGNYQNNVNSTCRINTPFNLSNIDNANLQFWLKTSLFLDSDALILEYSTNGSSWLIMDFYTGVMPWTLKSYSLNSFIGQNLYIRFRMYTDGGDTSNGVFIDDFKLYTNADASENSDSLIPRPEISLSANPNPFSSTSSISIKSSADLIRATIGIYNLKGQQVKSIPINSLTKGVHSFEWDGMDAQGTPTASGIYLIRLSVAAGTLATARIAHIK